MPVIKVWCLPQDTPSTLEKLRTSLIEATLSIRELDLHKADDVYPLFPTDMLSWNSKDAIIEVTGLFVKAKRTAEVRARLAQSLGETVSKAFPTLRVECFIFPFDPHQGFWTSNKTVVEEPPKRESLIVRQPPATKESSFPYEGEDGELTEVDLANVDFRSFSAKADGFKWYSTHEQIIDRIKQKPCILLGSKFLSMLIDNDEAREWLLRNNILRLCFLGSPQKHFDDFVFLPYLYNRKQQLGGRKWTSTIMSGRGIILKSGLYFPTLPK